MKKILLAFLFLYFHMLSGCAASSGGFDASKAALAIARTLGDAVIQAKGVAELQKAGAGLLVAAMDKQEPLGVLTLAEVESFITMATPEEIAALLAAWWLIRES